jgi:hypothetical protein
MLILLFRYVGMPLYISNNIQYLTTVAVKLPLYNTVWLVLPTACSGIYRAVPWDCGAGLPRASVPLSSSSPPPLAAVLQMLLIPCPQLRGVDLLRRYLLRITRKGLNRQ